MRHYENSGVFLLQKFSALLGYQKITLIYKVILRAPSSGQVQNSQLDCN